MDKEQHLLLPDMDRIPAVQVRICHNTGYIPFLHHAHAATEGLEPGLL
jgi:hypothetical protein